MAEAFDGIRAIHESELTASIERELTDEQLEEFAEGSCSWGANCTQSDSCGGHGGGPRSSK